MVGVPELFGVLEEFCKPAFSLTPLLAHIIGPNTYARYHPSHEPTVTNTLI